MEKFSIDRNTVDLYPDVIPALKALSDTFPIIALTDGNSDLSAVGIRHLFDGCVYAADIGHVKPHQAGFLKACEMAGTDPAAVIHIGDSPECDIKGAMNAGLKTMWIRRKAETWDFPYSPDYTIESLYEAVDILTR